MPSSPNRIIRTLDEIYYETSRRLAYESLPMADLGSFSSPQCCAHNAVRPSAANQLAAILERSARELGFRSIGVTAERQQPKTPVTTKASPEDNPGTSSTDSVDANAAAVGPAGSDVHGDAAAAIR